MSPRNVPAHPIQLPARTAVVLVFAVGIGAASRLAAGEPNSPGDEPRRDVGSVEFFGQQVAPLFARHCLGCHNASDKKGSLDLASGQAAAAGGDSGPAIEPGDVEGSLLWQRIDADEMPPDQAAKLSPAERTILRDWIAAGAVRGEADIDPLRFTTGRRAGYDWWSLAPIRSPALPEVADSAWPLNAIDRFILARLEEAGLRPAPAADRRTLIRRLSFDLLGLPPDPREVDAFVADPSQDAYARLVDRLLDSPHYGERWARHWLDVARYGESQGFERDRLRPNAWQYRDWVIAALNDDMPYDQFVRLQLAGDVLSPLDPSATIATGFLVAGAWDEVGQMQQSAAMRAVVRQDELEDLVGTTGQAFLGLTIHCARCHDHKFDPVSQVDYYRLAAALAGVRHGERATMPADARAVAAERRAAIESQAAGLREQLAAIDEPARARVLASRAEQAPSRSVPGPMASWDFELGLSDQSGSLDATLHGGARLAGGRLELAGGDAYLSTAPLDRPLKAKTLEAWVTLSGLDQAGGGVMSVQTLDGDKFDAIVYGERESRRWLAGSNGYSRTQDVGGPEETQAVSELVHLAIVYSPEQTVALYRNGRPYGRPYQATNLQAFEAGKAQVVFGLRHAPPGGNRVLSGSISRARLYDRALSADEIAASAGVAAGVADDDLLAELDPSQRERRGQLLLAVSRLEAQAGLLAGGPAYAVLPSDPEPCHVLKRGDTRQPGELVAAGGVASVAAELARFNLPSDAPEAERRRKLSEWITGDDNPLAARVIANRLWHYHFGSGIVETPNDLGFNGGRPSHPELLDWLAAELIRGGWSLKQLHRTILLSAAYRQSSAYNAQAAGIDASNRLLWRKSPLRLEAETIRDAVLAVSGELNPTMGGPGYQDFRSFTFNSQFYEPIDPVGYAFQRRSIYRTWVRSGTSPLLDVLDCPDPSTTAPARAVTTTPLQALALLNNSFMLRMADRFAARLAEDAPGELRRRIELAYHLAYSRQPEAAEVEQAQAFAAEHGLAAFCRVIFNSNEFLYVE